MELDAHNTVGFGNIYCLSRRTDKSLLIATLGILFTVIAVFNAGCCYARSCSMPADNADKTQIENSAKI